MVLKFSGAAHFRQRITLSLLTGKPVCIQEIRSGEENPGVKDFEVKFLRLVETLTNGTKTEVSYTGTDVTFNPGTLYGGEVTFDCGTERSVVYFLEPLLILAPFSKLAFRVTLDGLTSDKFDQSIDGVKNANCRILKWFGVEEGFDFKILRRGAPPLGGGRVFFTCPVLQSLRPINMTEVGKIKRIRGIASTTRISPQVANRLIEAARGQLNQYTPDVYIYSDVSRGEEAGLSPGYSLFLQAESTGGAIFSVDSIGTAEVPAEDIALSLTRSLLTQIKRSGMVDQAHQWMMLMLMALSPEDLSKVAIGPLAPAANVLLADLKTFLGVSFKIQEVSSKKSSSRNKTVLNVVSCIGSGYYNLNRRTQ